MNCDEAREALLEAELPLENDDGNSALAMHLRGCANCGALAAALENQLVAVRADYEELQPRMSTDAIASTVIERATVRLLRPLSSRGVELRGSMVQAGRKRRGIVATALLGAAIAAAITILVLHNNTIDRRDAGDPQPSAQRVPIEVEVAENQNAIVFETKNPNITVVWLYSGD